MSKPAQFTLKAIEKQLIIWQAEQASFMQLAEALPIRQDMLTFLAFIRDNKVVGTQSTGNMPLKAIREVTARFVNPPKLDEQIGNYTYRLRSEEDVWSLHFLHVLADVGNLLKSAPARRWQITAQAECFFETSSLVQTAFLLAVWWYKVNWMLAYPYEGMGKSLPNFFQKTTLDGLCSLPVGTDIAFCEYASQLINLSGLTWTSKDRRFHEIALQGAIKRMVVNMLVDFGALRCEYREETLGKGTTTRLDTIQLTPWGKTLLDAIRSLA